MLAADLAETVPTVNRATTGAEAARVVAEYRLSGLVVVDADENPIAVIPGSQILRMALPRYVVDDPSLSRTFDEPAADRLCARLNESTIGSLLDAETLTPYQPRAVRPADTLIEVASVMARGRQPLIVCRAASGQYVGAITMSRVLAAIALAAGQDSPLIRRRLDRDLAQRGQPGPPGPAEQSESAP